MTESPERFHLKAYNAFDLEKRFVDTVRYFKDHPLSKLWVVVPHHVHQIHWKKILADAKIPTINIHFTTPSQLRQKLPPLLHLHHPLPLNREAMRLILEKTCEPLTESIPLFQPLSRDARPLLRTLDEIENAGVSIQNITEIPELIPWFKIWESVDLAQWGRANQDHLILKAAQSLPHRLPESCIWLGLDRQALAFAPLLESTSLLFQKIATIHTVPELSEESIQQIWLQRVDEWLPQAQEKIPSEALDLEETTLPQASFFCAPSLRRESDLILSLIQDALTKGPIGEKVGVVIPSSSSIGYELSLELESLKIPFYSTWGEPAPQEPSDISLLALLKLQMDEIHSPDFIDFLEAHRYQEPFWKLIESSPLQISEIREHLYRSFQKTLSPRLSDSLPHPAVTRFLNFFQSNLLYPEELTLQQGIEITVGQIQKTCGLEASVPLKDYLEESLLDLDSVWKKPLSKKEYLKLLQRLLQSPEPKPLGDPWAPLWILRPEEATTLSWETLIFTQMNENLWPSLRDAGVSLLNDETRLQLNQRLASNPLFQPLTTLSSCYQMERARFDSLLASVRGHCVFTASATSELESGDELYPSEFYRQAWNHFHPQTPWKETFWNALLHQAPDNQFLIPGGTSDASPQLGTIQDSQRSPLQTEIQPLRTRFDPSLPFDSHFFCDTSKSRSPRPLSATHAEAILKDPAHAWFEIYLETKPLPDSWKSRDLLGLIQGNRLHSWLADSFRAIATEDEFTPLPTWEKWHHSLRKTLDRALKKHQENPNIPLWWKHHFPSLEWRAEKLLENLYQTLSQLPDAHIACEYRLKRAMIQSLPEFPLEQEWLGRIDWIALNDASWEKSKKIWILDLKTGNGSAPFHKGSLIQKAEYFQLLVYAGLAQAQHPHHPEISLGVILPKWAPPVEMSTLSAFDPEFQPLWQVLSAAWNKGIYGQTTEIHQRFSLNQDLPLATTPIPQDILDSKWEATPELSVWKRT
ncbi:MAG: PD-(D/E)XK nuclease family protein [Verrucomicrobiota bacterium]